MKRPEILIIEDDDWLAEQHARVLKRAGYKTKTALNALDAIRMIDDKIPDIIVLDILLTGSTAFSLLHELQSYGDTGNIPVVICSNLGSDLSLDDLESYGVRKILDKTKMVPQDLAAATRSVLY